MQVTQRNKKKKARMSQEFSSGLYLWPTTQYLLLWKITWLLLLVCKARSKRKCLHSVGDNSAERGLCPVFVTPEHQHKKQIGSSFQPSTPAELTSFPHRLMLKKWKNLVPREVKLGPLINEPTWLRLLKL